MAASMSSLLRRVAHRPEESLFNSLCIRSMSRGKYSIVPRSHFAMAVDNYTHFTSPIRRYVDMVVHRLLTQAVVNDDSMSQTGIVPYATACTYFNDMRDRARALQDISERQKSADFLRKKIGEEFMATITHVTPALMTVEMDRTGITGRVLLNTLIDDQYRLDYNTYVISGLKTGNCYRIGHRVRVRVSSVSVHRGIIDFTIVSREKVKGRWK